MTVLAAVPDPAPEESADIPPMLTADDVAAKLRVTRERVWQMRCRGQLPPAYKLSRTDVLWDPAEFAAWLETKKEK